MNVTELGVTKGSRKEFQTPSFIIRLSDMTFNQGLSDTINQTESCLI